MRALLLVPYYIHWHYGRALTSIVSITKTFIWFIWHFFSIGLLLHTFFDPWQRIHEQNTRKFDLSSYLSTKAINIVMRCVGIIVRLVFIIVGLLAIFGILLGGVATLVIWLVLPLAILFVFIFGIILLFKAS